MLEKGEAASLLSILKKRFEAVFRARAYRVGCGETRDESVVFGGEAELPASPDDSAIGGDVADGGAADELHAEGALDKFDTGG